MVERVDGALVLPLERADPRAVVLSREAVMIWRALGEHEDVDSVTLALADELGASPRDLRPDVDAFVSSLVELGLVVDS